MRSRGALLGLAPALRQRRGCPRLRPCPTPTSGHSLVSLRSASTQAPSASAAAKTYAHRPLQLNLGNNITVDLPASFASTGHPRGRKSRRRRAPRDVAQRASLSSSSDKTVAIHTVVEESRAVETTESTTTVAASADNFTIPRGGTAAAALLQCDTLVEALATPVSVAPFSLPPSAATTSPAGVAAAQTRVAAAQATFTALQTTALPLLFHFAAQQRLQQLQQQPDYKDSSVAAPHTSSGSVVSADRVAEALQTLHTHLENIAAAFHCDGRRHVSALPPPVVAALWEEVMPFLHQAALPQQNNAAHGADDRFTSSPPVSAVVPSQLKASYVAVRRALALHTRAVAPLLPPDALAVVLTRLFQCGALADDILGPVVTAAMEKQRAQSSGQTASPSAASTVGGTILILQQRVLRQSGPVGAAHDDAPAAFRGATAITMARLLGKAATPGHHQLHSFFHHALLPEVVEVLRSTAAAATDAIAVREGEAGKGGSTVGESSAHESTCGRADVVTAAATPPQPGTDALLDLTSAFRHYAVSGDAVQHLTTLWQAHFTIAAEAVTWRDCAALLRALSRLPIASSRSQRRQARQLARGSSGARQKKLLRSMVEEDYYPLVEVVCVQMRRLSEAMVAAAAAGKSPAAGAAATARVTAGLDVPPSELLRLLRMLLRVNSPHWAETYDALATAVFVRLATPQLSAEGILSRDLMNALSASEAQRTVMALLHRNSLIPDHPIHRVLLRRLLHAPEALTDPAVAAAALLGLEVMVPGDEGVVSEDAGQQHNPGSAASTPESTAMALAAPVNSDLVVTAEDRACALRLLRRHGRSMSPTAFVAGLCVAPIHQLPLSTQTALINHLTSVASAVPPVYLVKGMAAVVQSLHPSAVDDVSVRQWYSRFTARDVVRQVDAVGCAVLLDVLSANPRFEQHCVVAKQAITRRIGAALLHAGDDDEAGAGAEGSRLPTAASAGGLTLEQLPLIVSALRRGRVFLPPYFSRVCRLLLSQVETAALGDLLSPFSATAEEFMRRQQREGQASVFKDVWELLRGRVLEQVATLALTDTCTALNAFAALDVCDRPLFGVLVHHLWRCVQEAGLTATQPGDGGSDGTVREVEVGSGALDNAAGQGGSEEAEEAAVRRLAQVGEHITRALTPSAIAVVVTNLCAREDALQQLQQQQQGHQQDSAAALHRRSDTMLPWMLLALRDHHTELYPIDVVHLLPTLLQRYTAAAAVNGPLLPLLHAAYDACRTTFLHMYAVLPETAAVLPETTTTASAAASPAPAPESGVEGSTLTAEETRRIAAQRAAWTPAVQLSVRVVPRTWFAPILLRLSSAEVADVDVGLACVERVCTRRVCGMQLPVDQLVDVCLTMCWMFRMTDFGLDSSSSSSTSTKDMAAATAQACDEANVTAAGGAKAVLRPAMAVVLSALWYRCDELSAAHINAVLRCLADTYGADRVDDDFVQRLKAQKTLIDARQKKAAATAAGEAETQSTAGAAAPPFPTPSAVEEMQAEDLFSLM